MVRCLRLRYRSPITLTGVLVIERLDLRNFQRHRERSIEFERVTCLVGKTDSGKSTIVRALEWIATNRPQSDAFVHWDETQAAARLTFDEGRRIVRRRGRDRNSYSLDGQQYRAFGSEPPEPVTAALNIDPISFQGQFDAAFWFSLTPGQVARELNRMVNLELIDSATATATAELRKARTRAELAEERLTTARAAREQLAWVKQADERLAAVEAQENALTALDREINTLAAVTTKVRETRRRAAKRPPDSTQVDQALAKLKALDAEITGIREALVRVQEARENLCQAKRRAKAAAERLKAATGDRCPVCGSPMTL